MTNSQMRCLVLAFTGFMIVSGCAPHNTRLTSLNDVGSDEAVAIGRIHVKYNGEDITNGSSIQFAKGGVPLELDKSGFVSAKLPLGTHSIFSVWYPGFGPAHKLEGAFDLTRPRSVNYIGDITIDWTGPSVVSYK